MGALRGVRILDLSSLLPGPYATQLLGDLGAEVIKIERSFGDGTRHYPPKMSDGNSAMFHALNRGKKSVLLDLKSNNGKEKLQSLVRYSDVVVESFRPGIFEKLLEIPIKEFETSYPSTILCRLTGYGQNGPSSSNPGHDLNYCAKAGVLGMMTTPLPLPVQVADLGGGSWPAACQILAALYQREKTGSGCVIDVSLTDGAHSMLVLPLACTSKGEDVPSPQTDVLGGAVPCYNVYRTAKGDIAVGTLESHFWERLCDLLELEELKPYGLATHQQGNQVKEKLQNKFLTRTANEWEKICLDQDIPVERIRTLSESVMDPQMVHRNLMMKIKVGETTVNCVRPPLNMKGVIPCTSKGPSLGEHTEEIMKEIDALERFNKT